jgi:hypothetical protein
MEGEITCTEPIIVLVLLMPMSGYYSVAVTLCNTFQGPTQQVRQMITMLRNPCPQTTEPTELRKSTSRISAPSIWCNVTVSTIFADALKYHSYVDHSVMYNKIGGYFMTMETAHSFATKHGIDTGGGQSIEVSINNWLFDKKRSGFKAAAIQWPRPPRDWGELGIMLVTSFVSGYRSLAETEKDSAIAGWLVELGVARDDLQWVTLSDNLRITLEGNLDPHKSDFIFREVGLEEMLY